MTLSLLLVGLIFLIFALYNSPHGWDFEDTKNALIPWARLWLESPRRIYLTEGGSNYPLIETLAFSWPLSWLNSGGRSLEEVIYYFKWSQFLVDLANLGWIYLLLRALGQKRAWIAACLLFLLPSFWVDGGGWPIGDNLVVFFILMSWVGVAQVIRGCGDLKRDGGSFVIATLGVGLGLMSKHTYIFSLPVILLGILIAAQVLLVRHSFRKVGPIWILGFLGLVLPLFLADLWLILPPPFHDHLAFLWLSRKNYFDHLSGMGLNLWALLQKSDIDANTIFVFNLSYKQWGILLYLVSLIGLSGAFFGGLVSSVGTLLCAKYGEDQEKWGQRLMVHLLLLSWLTQLAFNLFLTDVRERYLIFGYPCYLVGAWVARRLGMIRSWEFKAAVILSVLYAYYVWLVMTHQYSSDPDLFHSYRLFVLFTHGELFIILAYRVYGLLNDVRASRLT